jgi:phosphatidylglycerophosphate synthase
MKTVPAAPFSAPRRALATRNAGWAKAAARRLGQAGVRPNGVSIAGVVLALASGVAFALAPELSGGSRAALLAAAAAGIQLRLLCNLLDGMLAVEGGLKSRTGDIYNDLPDRMADVFILVGAGYSLRPLAYGATLGWAAAVAALFTAYVRVLGGSLGVTQHFIGPMAKQHRMFTLTMFTLLAVTEALWGLAPRAIGAGLGVIVAGSVATTIRRTWRLAREVEAR